MIQNKGRIFFNCCEWKTLPPTINLFSDEIFHLYFTHQGKKVDNLNVCEEFSPNVTLIMPLENYNVFWVDMYSVNNFLYIPFFLFYSQLLLIFVATV